LRFIVLDSESSYARGLTLGKMIRDICIHNLSFLKEELFRDGLSLEYGLRLGSENERAIAEHFPQLLEEIRGLAHGADLPYSYILLETAFPFVPNARSDCTLLSAFGAAAADGTPLAGRNYDFLSGFSKCNQVRIVKKRNAKFSFVGGTVTILGVEEGLNNAGLFIGDAGCEPRQLPSSRGLSSRQVMELVLENCSSVDGAVDFLRDAPKFANSAGTCYLVVDKKEAVVVEMGLSRCCLRESEEGTLVASDKFLTAAAEEMKPSEPTALTKYNLAMRHLRDNKGGIDEAVLQRLLSDHRIPICAHTEPSTLRSVVAKTNQSKIMVSDGQPCTSMFHEVWIPT